MRITTIVTTTLVSAALGAGVMLAEPHGGDMIIGSTVDSGGALAIEYDFDTKVKTAFSAEIAGTSIYTATEPGLDALDVDEPLESFFALAAGTQVSIEITRIDAGKTAMRINAVTLDSTGDTVVLGTHGAPPPGDLHHHPEFQLLLMLPAGSFGEGRISFKLTTTSPTYAASAEYTITLTNGHLAGVDYDTATYDAPSVVCQKTVAKQVGKFSAAAYKLLAKCLDKVQAWQAKVAAAHPGAASAEAAAEVACTDATGSGPDNKTMLGRIEGAEQKAVDAIAEKCGSAGSGDYPETHDIEAHVGLARCRTEELISASYGVAKANLASFVSRTSQGGAPLEQSFPCLVPQAVEEEE